MFFRNELNLGFNPCKGNYISFRKENTMDNGTNMYMPVAPAYGYGNNSGFGNGMWGDGW